MPFAKSILVPTDFSSKSENAIRYACEIAASTGGEIHFLNVIEEPYDFPSRVDEIVAEKKKKNRVKLSALISDLHSVDDYRIIKMKGIVEVGKVQRLTERISEEYNHDLIVIGLGGETDLKKVLYGSITNNLLMNSSIPVLAISRRVDYRSPKTLLFATDMRDQDLMYIKMMREFSLDIGVSLRFIHITDENPEKIQPERISNFNDTIRNITKNPNSELTVFKASSFPEGITSYIKDDKHTFLVMPRYRKRFFEWLLSNSTIRSVAQMAAVPLLMLPADQ